LSGGGGGGGGGVGYSLFVVVWVAVLGLCFALFCYSILGFDLMYYFSVTVSVVSCGSGEVAGGDGYDSAGCWCCRGGLEMRYCDIDVVVLDLAPQGYGRCCRIGFFIRYLNL
jgi:hypothetical protein